MRFLRCGFRRCGLIAAISVSAVSVSAVSVSCGAAVQLVDEVIAFEASQLIDDVAAFFGFVPEEEHALCQFLLGSLGREYGFQGVGMETGIPGFGGHSHGSRSEVLYLLQVEVELLGDDCQFCHIFFGTAPDGC